MKYKTHITRLNVIGKIYEVYRVSINGIQTRMFSEQNESNARQLFDAYIDELKSMGISYDR